jgi:hypothetical protein
MRMVIEQLNLRPLQLTFDDFAAVEHLTAHHNDPFDHLFESSNPARRSISFVGPNLRPLCRGSAHLVANEKRCMAFGQIHL